MSIENRINALTLAAHIEHKSAEAYVQDAALLLAFLEHDAEAPARQATTPAADPDPQAQPKRRPGRPAKVTPEEKAAATEAEVVTEPEQPEAVEQPPKQPAKTPLKANGVDRDTVAKAMDNAVRSGQRDGLKAVLGKYGATNLTGIKPERYGEFLADIDKMMLTA